MFARTASYAAAYTGKTPSRDPELEPLLRWILEQDGTGLLFVGPRADALSNSSIADRLVKARRATFTTWKNGQWWRKQRVIALWPNAETLQKLHDVDTIEALGVLTWTLQEVEPWAAAVQAIDVLGGPTPATPTIADPIVLGAMRALTNSVNLSTGLAHPSDHDHAILTFRALRSRGHHIDGAAIEAWALSVGWSYRHAADLGKMAREMATGKAKRLSTPGGGYRLRSTAELMKHWAEVGAETDWKAY